MSRRSRIAGFGSAGLLVVSGAVVAAAVSGTTGQVLAFVLIGLGLVLVTALVFFEVGLSEDRERAHTQATSDQPRDGRQKNGDGRGRDGRRKAGDGRGAQRLDRRRGHRRRLK